MVMSPPGLLPRGAIPDVVVHLLVEQFHVLPPGRLGDLARRKIIEAGRRTRGHANATLVAPVQILVVSGVGHDLADQALFGLVGDVGIRVRRESHRGLVSPGIRNK